MRRVFTGTLCALAIVIGGLSVAAAPSQAQLFNSEKKQTQGSKTAPSPVYNSGSKSGGQKSGVQPLFLNQSGKSSAAQKAAAPPKMATRANGFDSKTKNTPSAADRKIREAAMARLARSNEKTAAVRATIAQNAAKPDRFVMTEEEMKLARPDRRFGAITTPEDVKAKEKAALPEKMVYDKHKGTQAEKAPPKLFNTSR